MRDHSTYACLSIRQPWASLCAWGIKDIENRSWYCAHRGPLVIHASKTWTREEESDFQSLLQLALRMGDTRRREILLSSRNLRGGLIGRAVMTGCVPEDEWYLYGGFGFDGKHEWFTGPFGYQLERAAPFPEIIPWKGRQGLFRVPKEVVRPFMEANV